MEPTSEGRKRATARILKLKGAKEATGTPLPVLGGCMPGVSAESLVSAHGRSPL